MTTSSPRHAAADGRANSFTKAGTVPDANLNHAMLWRNKSVSCDALRCFEASRKAYIDPAQMADRKYWEVFCSELQTARDTNARLVRFFTLKIQADMAYAESLRRLRLALETSDVGGPKLQMASSCDNALHALGESQQQLSDKIETFTNAIQRDVLARPLQEMVTQYEETATTMVTEGTALDLMLRASQKRVQESFAAYDDLYRDMERARQAKQESSSHAHDLWLAEAAYGVNVQKLQAARVEYVTGMANLFQQFKTIEVLRVAVTQTALDTYLRKQKTIFEELGGTMTEPLGSTLKMHAEKDLLLTIRRIPRNNTAMALAEAQEDKFFGSFRSPLASPLLVYGGFLRYQVSATMFKSWKDMFAAVTQDGYLHLFEWTKDKRPDAVLTSLPTSDDGVSCVTYASIYLPNSRLAIAKGTVPTFEVNEAVASSGLFSVFKTESTRRHIFQCTSQTELMDWVVAAKRLIPDPTARRLS
ncbi:hypothetical protein SPRG_19986 [Saprolegnia parasitica CBS 223.65]|uniref:PH domain-containing protein n=1 Tax=Saprolegnia parasitica (strain CBS 223.65) TaxID=695850 RepID=A0A067CHX8_SAPPC|nr:hypothetical protein SPRG_19986 [Saprolegnia parasitica CBS 223.65]KDO28775.1 hypothetical protein SPRG_19986 [Saprolegnia parasitica CBS 223.65]|eukprot:XP_012200517.1 hypothetical protein SPRG_19986 [Saprolegnia parasitica CBS 223.65]